MNKLQWNFNRNSNIFIRENTFESVVCEMAAMLSWPQCVNIGLIAPQHSRVFSNHTNLLELQNTLLDLDNQSTSLFRIIWWNPSTISYNIPMLMKQYSKMS